MRSSTLTSRKGRSRSAASAAATIAARLAPRSARRRTRRASTGTGCSAAHGRAATGDEPRVGQPVPAVGGDLLVAGVADHLEEGGARGVAHDRGGVPLARLRPDQRLVAGAGPQQLAADALEV